MGLYKKWKERNAFNAENCRRKQHKMENDRYEKKVEDIRARIDYVVSNCSDEHAVIYCVKNNEREMYEHIQDYFYNLGFTAVIEEIKGLNNEYLIVSW